MLRVKTHRANMSATKDQLAKKVANGHGKRKDFAGIHSRTERPAPLLRAVRPSTGPWKHFESNFPVWKMGQITPSLQGKFIIKESNWNMIESENESESCSVVSNSLRPHGLHSPWNSPGQNTGVGSLSLLQGIFPTQGSNQVSHVAGGFLTSWVNREAQEYWSK